MHLHHHNRRHDQELGLDFYCLLMSTPFRNPYRNKSRFAEKTKYLLSIITSLISLRIEKHAYSCHKLSRAKWHNLHARTVMMLGTPHFTPTEIFPAGLHSWRSSLASREFLTTARVYFDSSCKYAGYHGSCRDKVVRVQVLVSSYSRRCPHAVMIATLREVLGTASWWHCSVTLHPKFPPYIGAVGQLKLLCISAVILI